MFVHRKPSWKQRIRLAWRALRGEPLYADGLWEQLQQFKGSSASTKVTWRR